MKIIKVLLLLILNLLLISKCYSTTEIGKIQYSSDTKYYVIGRTDLRKCAYPMCGGYFLKEINSGVNVLQDIYVSKITLLSSASSINENKYRFAPSNEVVIYGTISGSGYEKEIKVEAVYRLLQRPEKGFNFDISTRFFKATDKQTIVKLNSNDQYRVDDILNSYGQSVSAIQLDWVDYKLNSGKSVFTMNENKISGNITIDYLFISLPDPSFCPMILTQINCQNSTVATYTRAPTRCQTFSGCVKKGPCPLSVINCPNGYNSVSIISKPKGCPKYYCDPSFLLN